MARRDREQSKLGIVLAIVILVAILTLLLFVEHLFNDELAVLYQETGELTELNVSFAGSIAYSLAFVLFAVLAFAGLKDDMNDFLMYVIMLVTLITFGFSIWCTSASIYGLHHSPNIKVRVLLAIPVSTMLATPFLLFFSAILSRRYADEPRAFPFILWFPLLSLVIGYVGALSLSFIPTYLVFLNIYCLGSAALFVGAAIFLTLSHPLGEVLGFTIDFIQSYSDYSSGGGGGSTSYSSQGSSNNQETVPDYVLDSIATAINREAHVFWGKSHIEGVSVQQSGSTIQIHVNISFSFDDSYSEYDVNTRVERESEEIRGSAVGLARERLHYYEIYYIDDIEVNTSSDISYYG